MRKCEDFFGLVERVVKGSMLRTYGDVILNPECLSIYLKDKDETINVWDDVKLLVNKQLRFTDYSGYAKKHYEKMLKVVQARLAWLKGTYKNPLNIEKEKRKYILNINDYSKFFTEETISKALNNVDIRDFMTMKDCYGYEESFAEQKDYFEAGFCSRKKSVKDAYGRYTEVIEKGHKYFVPDSYQLKEEKFLKDCLYIEYPYMSKYDIQIYHLEKPYEMYVKTENKGSLYVPFECLKNKTIEPAVKRMTEYFNWYYNRNPDELKKNLDLMKTKTFKELKKDIERC